MSGAGGTHGLPQLGLTACTVGFSLFASWLEHSSVGWRKELFQDPRGVWGCFPFVLSLCWLQQGQGEGQCRTGLLWGCCVVQVMFGGSSPILPAPLLPLVWFGKQLMDLFIPLGSKACVGAGGCPEEGLGSCLLAGEGVGRGAVLEGWGRRPGWDFHRESALVLHCSARSVGLSFPVFLWLALEQGRAEEPPARWLWELPWAHTVLCSGSPGSLARAVLQLQEGLQG